MIRTWCHVAFVVLLCCCSCSGVAAIGEQAKAIHFSVAECPLKALLPNLKYYTILLANDVTQTNSFLKLSQKNENSKNKKKI